MNHPVLKRLLRVLLLCLVPCIAACTSEPSVPLRLGTNVWPGYEPLFLAGELGYYPSATVKLVEYHSASEVIRAFRNGAIDAAALTLDEVLLLAQSTSDVRIMLVVDTSHGADVVMARPGLATLRDLKGKRVGLETGALGAYVLTRALQSVGMKPADVQLVPLDVFEHEKAYRDGRVDALVTFEPVKTKIGALGARQVFDSTRIPGEILDVLIVRNSYAMKNRSKVEHLAGGWFKALALLKQDRDRAVALMAARERLKADEFSHALGGLRLTGLEENRAYLAGPTPGIIAAARRLNRVMLDNRLIDREVPVTGIIDGTFLGGKK